jgi:hypothetical protein
MTNQRQVKQGVAPRRASQGEEGKARLGPHHDLVQALKKRLTVVAGDGLQASIFYGSRAWGRPESDSDLDVAVLVQAHPADRGGPLGGYLSAYVGS